MGSRRVTYGQTPTRKFEILFEPLYRKGDSCNVSIWDAGKGRDHCEREDARKMSVAGLSRKNEDIASTKAAYALAGSLVAGMVLWISAIALIV